MGVGKRKLATGVASPIVKTDYNSVLEVCKRSPPHSNSGSGIGTGHDIGTFMQPATGQTGNVLSPMDEYGSHAFAAAAAAAAVMVSAKSCVM